MNSIPTTILSTLFAGAALISHGVSPIDATKSRSAAEDVFARSRAMYASLRSYADTGTVDIEYGSPVDPTREHHTFVTYYRAPRKFYFEFVKEHTVDRLVVWGDDVAFHGWWLATGNEVTYPKGQGTSAFVSSDYPTKGSISLISPMLFSKAGLVGTLTHFGDATDTGTDYVGGRPCHKLVGVARDVYGLTGRVVNVRKTTVWIDNETLLVRRVLEEGREPPGRVSRRMMTLLPHANPTIEEARFKFNVPSMQK